MRDLPLTTTTGHRRRTALVTRFAAAGLLAVALSAAAASCSSSTPTPTTTSAAPTVPATAAVVPTAPGTTVAVAKEVLAREVDPPGAPGRTLTLMRYTIAPGAQLPAHIHPGVQLAAIDAGTLTYTVVSGTATVTRAGQETPEPVTAPATITLGPGDSVAENDGMVHYGANKTDRPVLITATLLTDSSKDLAVTVSTTTP